MKIQSEEENIKRMMVNFLSDRNRTISFDELESYIQDSLNSDALLNTVAMVLINIIIQGAVNVRINNDCLIKNSLAEEIQDLKIRVNKLETQNEE